MRIYPRGGDDGTTGLFGGERVSKSHVRVEAYGMVDELNALLGWARVAPLPAMVNEVLAQAQESCFRLGAILASSADKDPGVEPISKADVEALEQAIDRTDEELPPLKNFILPGGSEGGARLHVARAVCRRAERALVELSKAEPVDPLTLQWLNRLGDLLFVKARLANANAHEPEVVWRPKKG